MGLDSVDIIIKVEKSFGIRIPNREAEKICTVGDIHNAVWQKLENANRQEMENVINHIIADIAGVELEEVTSEKRIADDLGID